MKYITSVWHKETCWKLLNNTEQGEKDKEVQWREAIMT
jgi:hypothetical protein